MEPLIEARDLHKSYVMGRSRVDVLRGVAVAVTAGETVAITGPSGAGKSTLLHALGGLDRPTAGTVAFKGRDLYALSARERTVIRARQVGFVFQSFHLLPELDVLENVLLPVMSGRDGWQQAAARRDRARELLAAVGLAERMHHTPLELSGGEQQRVALARALINDPELVLADEPTGNLDSVTGAQVLKCLMALTRESRHTLVIVTHNTDIAGQCDRVLRMRDGVFLSDDVPADGVTR
jgi:ABC-type lipoprotein export system ATPase subunit